MMDCLDVTKLRPSSPIHGLLESALNSPGRLHERHEWMNEIRMNVPQTYSWSRRSCTLCSFVIITGYTVKGCSTGNIERVYASLTWWTRLKMGCGSCHFHFLLMFGFGTMVYNLSSTYMRYVSWQDVGLMITTDFFHFTRRDTIVVFKYLHF